MTEDDVRAMIRKDIPWKGAGKFANQIGISKSMLSEMLSGKKALNDTILAAVGLERRIVRLPRKTVCIPNKVGAKE